MIATVLPTIGAAIICWSHRDSLHASD